MSLTRGGRRAEPFNELLEAPIARTDDPDVAPTLALATALRALPAAQPARPEFRDALRQRLMAVAAVQGVGEAAQTPAAKVRELSNTWRFQRRMAVVAGSAAAITAVTGVGIGASRSLPGDPFYGVKRASEDVQLAATFGDEAKGKRHLEFARTRLGEVEALAGRSSALTDFMPGAAGALGPLSAEDKSSTIVATLGDMDEETRAGSDALVEVALSSGSTEPLRALDEFTQEQFADLKAVLPALPQDARSRARTSLALLTAVATRTVAVANPSKVDETPGTDPTPSVTKSPPKRPGSGGSKTPEPTATTEPGTSTTTPAPTDPVDPGDLTPTIPTLPTTLPPILPTELPELPLPTVTDLPLLGG
jgi:hypothetical protein